MSQLGYVTKDGPNFEFHYPEHGMVVRGPYIEWVLEAAAEVIAETEKLKTDGQIEELKTLVEFGEADSIEVDAAEFDANARFDIIPQCLVSMGSMAYRWVAPAGREQPPEGLSIKRLHDMSLRRSDSFLKNEDGVDTIRKP